MGKTTTLALGADIKNRFLLARGRELYFGPCLSDLSDARNYEVFTKEVRKAVKRTRPDIVACDLHPGYFSTRLAEEYKPLAKGHGPRLVQHHHAHIASVMFEHGLKGPVVGVAFDGTGYGTDGNIWGGEFLVVDRKGFKRAAHLKYWKMPGGDKVVAEPWRMVLSILGEKGSSILKSVPKKDNELVMAMLKRDINSPLTSSAGRLFDAASALLGLCLYAEVEAEGPVKLELACDEQVKGSYEFRISPEDGCDIIDTKGLFAGMAADLKKGRRKEEIAAKFHNSMREIIVKTVKKISRKTGIKDVALSGGVFQNRFLASRTTEALARAGFKVVTNKISAVNDLNIALGQYYVSGYSGKN
jgi:hydrogenase maturation protein HypF